MKAVPFVSVCTLLVACATSGGAPGGHWERTHGGPATAAAFSSDNDSCGAESSRRAPTPRPDQAPPGATAPRNAIDRPPRVDTNPTRQRAYMECMAERGWRPVQ